MYSKKIVRLICRDARPRGWTSFTQFVMVITPISEVGLVTDWIYLCIFTAPNKNDFSIGYGPGTKSFLEYVGLNIKQISLLKFSKYE